MKRHLLVIICIFAISAASAQQEMGLYYLNEVQQGSYANPAHIPLEKINFNLALPVPAFAVNAGFAGFTLGELYNKSADSDSLQFNLKQAVDIMGKKNFLALNAAVDYFSLNLPVRNITIGVNVSDKVNFNSVLYRDFFKLLLEGNAQYIGETVEIKGIKFNLSQYREYGISGAWEKNKFAFGVRLKYLHGLANANLRNNNTTLHTDSNNYNITLEADYTLNTTSFGDLSNGNLSFGRYFFNRGNKGFAVDLGVKYPLNEKLSVSGSLIDFGFINWSSNTINYRGNGSYTFEAVDIDKGGAGNFTFDFENLMDSLTETFAPKETNESYKTRLVARTYLSGAYQLNESTEAGLIFCAEFYEGLNPAVSGYIQRRMGKIFIPGIHVSYKNRSFLNIGASSVLNLGAFQMFIVSDNILAFFSKKAGIPLSEDGDGGYLLIPKSSNNFNLRFGINWAFKERTPEVNINDPIPGF